MGQKYPPSFLLSFVYFLERGINNRKVLSMSQNVFSRLNFLRIDKENNAPVIYQMPSLQFYRARLVFKMEA